MGVFIGFLKANGVTLHYIIYLKMLKNTFTLNINTNSKSLAQFNKTFLQKSKSHIHKAKILIFLLTQS